MSDALDGVGRPSDLRPISACCAAMASVRRCFSAIRSCSVSLLDILFLSYSTTNGSSMITAGQVDKLLHEIESSLDPVDTRLQGSNVSVIVLLNGRHPARCCLIAVSSAPNSRMESPMRAMSARIARMCSSSRFSTFSFIAQPTHGRRSATTFTAFSIVTPRFPRG